MIKVSEKFLEKLREAIDSSGRTDGQLVRFFNNYGFKDIYHVDSFPSRIQFIEERLAIINSQWGAEEIISDLLNPINTNETGLAFYKKFSPLDTDLQKEGLKLIQTSSGINLLRLNDYERSNHELMRFVHELRWRGSNPISAFISDIVDLIVQIAKIRVVLGFRFFWTLLGIITLALCDLAINTIFGSSFAQILKPYTDLVSDFFNHLTQ